MHIFHLRYALLLVMNNIQELLWEANNVVSKIDPESSLELQISVIPEAPLYMVMDATDGKLVSAWILGTMISGLDTGKDIGSDTK